MNFTLKINCDNDAFQPDPSLEIMRILQDVCKKIESYGIDKNEGTIIKDINGNTIGKAELK